VALVVVGMVPAAFTVQVPHSNQALAALSGWVLLCVAGVAGWRYWWRRQQQFFASMVALWLVLVGLSFIHDWQAYERVMQKSATVAAATLDLEQRRRAVDYFFAVDLLDALRWAHARESQVREIVVVTGLEHEYIYALLARGTKPINYRGGSLSEKYRFLPKIQASDWERDNTLLVVSAREMAAAGVESRLEPSAVWRGSDGEENLLIYWTPVRESEEEL
jgi:hypothetical protein